VCTFNRTGSLVTRSAEAKKAPGGQELQGSGRVAVVSVMSIIGIAMAFIATEPHEIDFVENDSQEFIVDAMSRTESVLGDVDLGFSPFYNKNVGIKDSSGGADVHYRNNWVRSTIT
jgi:hypothetical protein